MKPLISLPLISQHHHHHHPHNHYLEIAIQSAFRAPVEPTWRTTATASKTELMNRKSGSRKRTSTHDKPVTTGSVLAMRPSANQTNTSRSSSTAGKARAMDPLRQEVMTMLHRGVGNPRSNIRLMPPASRETMSRIRMRMSWTKKKSRVHFRHIP